MTSAIASIALLTPIVASNAVFSARRMSKGIDAMDSNPLLGIANMDVAAAQVVKGGRAANAIALATAPAIGEASQGAAEAIKAASNSNKIVRGLGKIVKVTADNINPVIIGVGLLKVAAADDKVDEAGRESLRLGTMFTAERVTKSLIGLPTTRLVEGKLVADKNEGLYKKLLSEKQNAALQDFIKTKKCMKYAAGGAKGLLFVGASIAGYQLGDMLADSILGKKTKQAS